ncbi:hypothetical protein LPB19_12505 [Marinobacter salinisoli]|uniref:FCP1 homology domain-containing protein n=1 Tax=Marinobacter salinisoli TaxID=2769486 RepID=A0ABX7MRG1_9GAMM|nr:NIF family HAD-type phosphatase [Marinobacter salinisoli]QSP94010.1 hypothetical protein LPB19_12505 [Marinobacter salinisoli]
MANVANRKMSKPLLCLDLEGTLVSNAVSQIPRPGLYFFLEEVASFCDLMIYTSVSDGRVENIRNLLVIEGVAPLWFTDLPVIRPETTLKPKAKCGREDAYLLDDQKAVIVPGEEDWWIPIEEFLPPYSEWDRGLMQALIEVRARLGSQRG